MLLWCCRLTEVSLDSDQARPRGYWWVQQAFFSQSPRRAHPHGTVGPASVRRQRAVKESQRYGATDEGAKAWNIAMKQKREDGREERRSKAKADGGVNKRLVFPQAHFIRR